MTTPLNVNKFTDQNYLLPLLEFLSFFILCKIAKTNSQLCRFSFYMTRVLIPSEEKNEIASLACSHTSETKL